MRITILLLFIFIKTLLYGQHDCSHDTTLMIKNIRTKYQQINNKRNTYKLEKQGTIDFDANSDDYASGDNSWYGKETKKYFDNGKLIVYIENTRNGAWQVGETRTYKQYYIQDSQLFFYFEREIFISTVPDGMRSYANEWRIYYCNGDIIRYLKKEIDLGKGVGINIQEENYSDAVKRILKEQNKGANINLDKKWKEVKTNW